MKVLFFLREAFRALRRSAAPSVAAIVTIVITVLLLGVYIPVIQTTQGKTDEVRSKVGLEVFLYDDATKAEASRLGDRLRRIPHITEAKYVSKDQALQILQSRLRDKDIVRELSSNPLPASYSLRIDDIANLGAVRSALEPPNARGKAQPISPLIDQVKDSRQEASKISKVTGALKIVLTVITGLLLLASLMLVGNTIRLSIYARRREVEVMRLVGATNWFIRWPFVLEGIVVGLVGSGLAVGLLWLGKATIVDPLSDNFALVAAQNTIDFVPLTIMLVGAAALVSAIGSGITLSRFLKI